MSDVEAVRERMHSVHIGRRFVGEIPEEDWIFIMAEVNTDSRIWKAQARNLLRVAVRLLGFGFIGVPLGVFWTAVLFGWLGKPVPFPTPGQHIGELMGHPDMVAAGVALAVGSMLALGLKPGYVNFFAKARSALVKDRLGLDEPGDCVVR